MYYFFLHILVCDWCVFFCTYFCVTDVYWCFFCAYWCGTVVYFFFFLYMLVCDWCVLFFFFLYILVCDWCVVFFFPTYWCVTNVYCFFPLYILGVTDVYWCLCYSASGHSRRQHQAEGRDAPSCVEGRTAEHWWKLAKFKVQDKLTVILRFGVVNVHWAHVLHSA